jgi:hypothetical protein
MTITYREVFGSQQGTEGTNLNSTDRLLYVVEGTDDLDDAEDALEDVIPAINRGLVFESLEHEQLGPTMWQFQANYKSPQRAERETPLAVDEYKISFSTTGGTTKVFQAWETNAYAADGYTAPDFKGAIGVNKDGEVEGVDIVVPRLTLDITYKKANADITLPYLATLRDLTGRVNDATFFGFAAGEVLFIGADGTQALIDDPEITYHFIIEPALVDETIGEIEGVYKAGHAYLWPYYEATPDGTAKKLIPRPKVFYEALVYREGDFSLLGIGGSA